MEIQRNLHRMEELLERYFEGETSAAEEKQIRAFFASGQVPEHWAVYIPLFAYFDEEIERNATEQNEKPDWEIEQHIVGLEYCEAFLVTREVDVVLAVELHTCHEVETMLTYLLIIGSDGIPHPLGPVFLLCLYCILVVGHVALGYRIGEEALLLL